MSEDEIILKRRLQDGEPLQYILGTCNFMGLELQVNPSVLIPRPETEQLVDAALKIFKGGHALDLGTGSGNIAIALAKFVPQSQIVSVDVSAEALEIARVNARRHGVEDRIQFIQDDFLVSLRAKRSNPFKKIASSQKSLRWEALLAMTQVNEVEAIGPFDTTLFDLIISNPPYIPTSQLSSLPRDVQQEPVTALDGGEDGLNFYRIIVKYTPCLLTEGGCLMMEFGDACLPAGRGSRPQSDEIRAMIEETKLFSKIEILKDLAERDRIMKAIR